MNLPVWTHSSPRLAVQESLMARARANDKVNGSQKRSQLLLIQDIQSVCRTELLVEDILVPSPEDQLDGASRVFPSDL